LCTEKEIEEIQKKIKNYEKILKERNSIFKTVMDALCENLNKKKNELLEEMGILGD
jgi:nitrate reductase assembly molybdenum cofactor insertion protein NarJ